MNQLVSIGSRLAEERKRKGLNQSAFAEIGGVSVKTQVLYEKAERVPDANYLAAIAEAGFDVLYILTGAPNASAVAGEEAAVLAGYRKLDARGRAGVLALIGGMQKQPAADVHVKGDVGQYVVGDVTAPFTIDMGKKSRK